MAQIAYSRTARAVERTVSVGWRFLASPHVMLVWLGILLVVSLLGGILPQVPPGVSQDSAEYAQWLSQIRARWGASVEPLQVLGLLNIFGSRFFRALLAIASVIATLRLLYLWIPSWKQPPLVRTASFLVTLPHDAQQASHTIARALAVVGQRLSPWMEGDGVRYTVARRSGITRWLPGLLYLGVLLFLLSGLVGWQFGWRGEMQELVLGETRPLGSGRPAVRLDEIAVMPGKDGTMQRFDSHMSLLNGPDTVAHVVIGQGKRATYGGLALYQVGYGPAVRVSAHDAQGRTLSVRRMVGDKTPQRQVRLRFSETSQEQLLSVPEANLAIRMVHYPTLPAQGIQGRALHVQVYEETGGKLVEDKFLAQDEQLTANDVTIDLAFEYYVNVRAEQEPELPLALAGGSLMFLGLLAAAIWPPREVWVTLVEQDNRSFCRLDVPSRDSEADWFRGIQAILGEEAHV